MIGGMERKSSYVPTKIVSELVFSQKKNEILSHELGNGLLLWKPYIILKTLMEIQKRYGKMAR